MCVCTCHCRKLTSRRTGDFCLKDVSLILARHQNFKFCFLLKYFYHGRLPERQSHGHAGSCFFWGTSKFWEVGWQKTRTNVSAKSATGVEKHTFSQLSHNFLTILSQFSQKFLTTFSHLSHNFFTNFSQLYKKILKTFTHLSQNFLTTFTKIFTTFSQLSHNCLYILQLSWQT